MVNEYYTAQNNGRMSVEAVRIILYLAKRKV